MWPGVNNTNTIKLPGCCILHYLVDAEELPTHNLCWTPAWQIVLNTWLIKREKTFNRYSVGRQRPACHQEHCSDKFGVCTLCLVWSVWYLLPVWWHVVGMHSIFTRWIACYFPLHTPPYSFSSQEIRVLILRGKSTKWFCFFAPDTFSFFYKVARFDCLSFSTPPPPPPKFCYNKVLRSIGCLLLTLLIPLVAISCLPWCWANRKDERTCFPRIWLRGCFLY